MKCQSWHRRNLYRMTKSDNVSHNISHLSQYVSFIKKVKYLTSNSWNSEFNIGHYNYLKKKLLVISYILRRNEKLMNLTSILKNKINMKEWLNMVFYINNVSYNTNINWNKTHSYLTFRNSWMYKINQCLKIFQWNINVSKYCIK